jgi:glycosyltransferase involved in cell wall biosynthesis
MTASGLRVLHVIPAIAPRYGGPSAATFGLCRALRARGIDTLVATTDADGPGRLDVPIEQAGEYHGVPVIFFRRRFSEAFKWTWRLRAWLTAHATDFDVVHIHAVFSHSSLVAGRVCRDAGVPYIVRPLGTLDPWSVSRKWLQKQILFRAGVTDVLAGAAAIHYTSEDEMALAESAHAPAGKGVVIPLGIDDEVFREDEADELVRPEPYVLALSRLDEKKGLDLLIEAFEDAVSCGGGTQWRLVIAGDGPADYVARLRAIANASPAASRITFSGWVSGGEKLRLLREARLFALPSHQENFGISVVESMASGVPVLVTPGVNLARDIRAAEAGWVVERDRAAIAAALVAAISDEADAQRRGRQARAFAERFRWPSVATRLIPMYDDVAAPRRMPAAVGL